MKPNKAFIAISGVAYIACLAMTLMGRPPILGADPMYQTVVYILLAVFLLITAGAYAPQDTMIKAIWVLIYGFGAMCAFSGFVVWAGGDNAGFFMCLWDLALGVALLVD